MTELPKILLIPFQCMLSLLFHP